MTREEFDAAVDAVLHAAQAGLAYPDIQRSLVIAALLPLAARAGFVTDATPRIGGIGG